MNDNTQTLRMRASVLAIQAAMATLATMSLVGPARAAGDLEADELTNPTSTVEVGVGATGQASAKAQEYNGIARKGSFGVFNLDLRGGGAYDSGDLTRWRFTASDLGLDNRSLGLTVSEQGKFQLNLNYDELLRQRSDTYQTPFLGAGTNTLTLPSNWLVPTVPRNSAAGNNARGLSPAVSSSSVIVAGVMTAPSAAQLTTSANIQAADLPAFQAYKLQTKRTKYGAGLSYEIDKNLEFTASYAFENKVGTKPMGFMSCFTGCEVSSVLPDLIDQNHEQINVGLNYTGEAATLSLAYYGSLFTNNVPSMNFAVWSAPTHMQSFSVAPSNQFHQLSANGAYKLSSTTRLSGNISYGRATQNEAFLTDPVSAPMVPVSSLNGLVVSTAVNLKLQSRPIKDLLLSAAYKLDDRDNRTAVNTYGFNDAGSVPSGVSPFASAFPGYTLGLSDFNINANRPYSKKLNQFNLDGDYTISRGQAVKLGAEFQKIDRQCNGSWIACADADTSKESTLRADYRLKATEDFSVRVGLSAARRTVNYNEDAFLALVPAANLLPSTAPAGVTTSAYATLTQLGYTGYGPVAGLPSTPLTGAAAFYFTNNNALVNALYGSQNRISELPGMRRFNMADRDRNKFKVAANWAASDALTLQAGVDVNDDRYGNSVYGLQSAKGWAFNADGSYAVGENTSASLFYTLQDQKSVSAGNSYSANSTAVNVNGFTAIPGSCANTIAARNASYKRDTCLDWNANMRDKVNTLGLAFTQKNLVGGKLDLSGGLTFSQASSDNVVNGGTYANNPYAVANAPAGTAAAYYIPATPLPTVKTDTTELKLGARYALSKQRTVRVAYSWQHMKAVDWAYEGFQPGGLGLVLPTYEQAPNYNVHTLAVSYIYAFR